MRVLLERVRSEALNLTSAERKKLIHVLVDSLAEEMDADFEGVWNDEITRRIREVEEGKVECLSHDEVMAKARAACR